MTGQEREAPVEAVGAVVLYLQECRRAKIKPSESEIARVAVHAADTARAALTARQRVGTAGRSAEAPGDEVLEQERLAAREEPQIPEQAYEALQAAMDFIQTVERWKGSDPDEIHELIALVETALAAREDTERPDGQES
jgi:hypothetical protein